MSLEYIKNLEDRIDQLSNILSRRDKGDIVYIVKVKDGHRLAPESPQVFLDLNSAFISYSKYNEILNDDILNEDPFKFMKIILDIYEYNVRSEVMTKVFG